MKLKKYPFLFLIIFIAASTFGQNNEYIHGKLYDKITKEPIVFATIAIKNKSIGVVSNEDGGFRIPIKFQKYNDTLLVSSMGYGSKEILLSNLSLDVVNSITLEPMLMELQEVTVSSSKHRRKRLSAKRIVQKAIANIPLNYPTASNSYVGYYRDYQIKSGEYYNLNEAIVEVFDRGFNYNDFETTNVRLYDYERNPDFPRDTLADNEYNYIKRNKIIPNAHLRGYGGNEFVIMRIMDAIRNYNTTSYSYVDKMDVDFIKNHKLKLENDVYVNNESVFKISFLKSDRNIMVEGAIYIAKDNFAIHKLDYAVYKIDHVDGISWQWRIVTNEEHRSKLKRENLLYQIRVEYKENKDLMYPNYVSFKNTFLVKEPPVFRVDAVNINFKNPSFEVYFNKKPIRTSAHGESNFSAYSSVEPRNYELIYKGKSIRIRKAILKADINMVLLYPWREGRSQEIFKKGKAFFNKEDLVFRVKNIIDYEGNHVNESKVYKSNQFREFFLQKVNSEVSFPVDSLYMIKEKPIFKNQPIAKPDNYEDYWMNTPLKK